MVEGRF